MKTFTKIAAIGLMTALAAGSVSADEGWTTDLAAAKETAKAEGKSILMNITGSDWWGACKRIEGSVLSKEDFIAKASEKFILLEVDFPRAKEQSDELKAQNAGIAAAMKIRAYPTFIVTDAEGAETARSLGAPAGDIAGFLAWLEDNS